MPFPNFLFGREGQEGAMLPTPSTPYHECEEATELFQRMAIDKPAVEISNRPSVSSQVPKTNGVCLWWNWFR